MRATIEYVGGESAYEEFYAQERTFAMAQEPSHETVGLAGYVEPYPQEGQRRVEPIHREQQQAFVEWGQERHLANVVKLLPYYARTPEAKSLGVHDVHGRNEPRYLVLKRKS